MQTQPKQEMTPIPMSDVQLTAPMSDQMHPEATLTPSQQTVPHSPPPTSTPSASTNVNSPNLGEPDGDIQSSKKKPRSHSRGVGKIRRHRMTKEEEARFNPTDFNDLKGSTAAKSRKMSLSERDIMLHKRRLRNRQSAARSRDKQRKTIGDVGEEVDALLVASAEIRARCFNAEKEIKELRAANESLRKENEGMKQNNMKLTQSISELRQNGVSSPAMKRNGSTLRFSVSTDMLDKIIGGTADGAGLGETPGMNKIPSTLQLSFSTDKLSEIMPSCSGTLPPMPRNHSIMERLLDFANSNANGNINNSDYDSIEINIDTGVKKE